MSDEPKVTAEQMAETMAQHPEIREALYYRLQAARQYFNLKIRYARHEYDHRNLMHTTRGEVEELCEKHFGAIMTDAGINPPISKLHPRSPVRLLQQQVRTPSLDLIDGRDLSALELNVAYWQKKIAEIDAHLTALE